MALALLLCGSPVWAQRSAVIVANDGRTEEALRLSRTLLAQGYLVERRVGLGMGDAFPEPSGVFRVVFFSGGIGEGGRLLGVDDLSGWDIPQGVPQLVALNVCGDVAVDAPPQTLLVRGCGDGFADSVIGALGDQGDLAAALRAQGLTVQGSLARPVPARVAMAEVAPIMGDIVISAPVAAPIQPIGGGDVQIIAASAEALRARPVAAGMPRPSVIVGTEPDAPAPPPARVTDAAERLEQRGAPDYADRIALGIYDPDEGDLPRAIQAELQRLGCYSAAVDGVWGNGSRQAVARFNEVAANRVALAEPSLATWRELIAQPEDRRCHAPVATTPTTRRTPVSAAPQQAAPPPAAEPENIAPNFFGTGIFR